VPVDATRAVPIPEAPSAAPGGARGSDGTLPRVERRTSPREPGQRPLTAGERDDVRRLQQVDREVRSHEAAHQAAGGAVAGAATFTYEMGPDGRAYAVAGEVPIRAEAGRTPEETIAAARRMRAAALAPADPSPQDLAVAAEAAAMEAQATAERSRHGSGAPAKHRAVQAYERAMAWR